MSPKFTVQYVFTRTMTSVGRSAGGGTPLAVAGIAAKLLGDPDRDGDVYFAVKATVGNSTARPVRGQVTLQAVDADGFLLSEVTLDGLLGPSESRVFTNRFRIQASEYDEIDRWQVSGSEMWDVD